MKIIDLFSRRPQEVIKKVKVTINNQDIHSRVKVGNIYMNRYVIVSMVCVATDSTVARTYELTLRKL